MLALIIILHQHNGIRNRSEADGLLFTGGYRYLNEEDPFRFFDQDRQNKTKWGVTSVDVQPDQREDIKSLNEAKLLLVKRS